jgi:hypothetical protein
MCRFQYLARRVERLSMGCVPVRQFGADSVGQVFAVVNVEKESGYRRAYRAPCGPTLAYATWPYYCVTQCPWATFKI